MCAITLFFFLFGCCYWKRISFMLFFFCLVLFIALGLGRDILLINHLLVFIRHFLFCDSSLLCSYPTFQLTAIWISYKFLWDSKYQLYIPFVCHTYTNILPSLLFVFNLGNEFFGSTRALIYCSQTYIVVFIKSLHNLRMIFTYWPMF